MKNRIVLVFFIIMHALSCTSNEDIGANDLTEKIEENVLDMIFQADNAAPCSIEENIVMMAADSGNYEVVIDYLKNGGDPMLECECEKKSHYDCTNTRLSSYMQVCDSIGYVKYYLNLEIADEIKNEFFDYYLILGSDEMAQYLISIGAQLTDHYICFPTTLPRITKAVELGYDINSQDSKNGWTLLMQFAFCENEDYVDCKLEGIEYLISEGALLDLKNNEGKTALDIATNEKIKTYLESLEN